MKELEDGLGGRVEIDEKEKGEKKDKSEREGVREFAFEGVKKANKGKGKEKVADGLDGGMIEVVVPGAHHDFKFV